MKSQLMFWLLGLINFCFLDLITSSTKSWPSCSVSFSLEFSGWTRSVLQALFSISDIKSGSPCCILTTQDSKSSSKDSFPLADTYKFWNLLRWNGFPSYSLPFSKILEEILSQFYILVNSNSPPAAPELLNWFVLVVSPHLISVFETEG